MISSNNMLNQNYDENKFCLSMKMDVIRIEMNYAIISDKKFASSCKPFIILHLAALRLISSISVLVFCLYVLEL